MKCADNCGYFWRDADKPFPTCHYLDHRFPAPCEQDDDYVEPVDYEDCYGYDDME